MDEIDEMAADGTIARLNEEATALCKRMGFDSIQIIATQADAKHSRRFAAGYGNWYARFGAARMWVTSEEHTDYKPLDE